MLSSKSCLINLFNQLDFPKETKYINHKVILKSFSFHHTTIPVLTFLGKGA